MASQGVSPFEGHESSTEFVRSDEVGEMSAELVVTVVVTALDGRVLDRAVHALDLAVGPRVLGLGQPVLDIELGAGIFEGVSPEAFAVGDGQLNVRHGRAAGAWRGEVDAVVGENRVRLVGTASTRRRRKSPETRVVAFSCSSTKANLVVRSMATKR